MIGRRDFMKAVAGVVSLAVLPSSAIAIAKAVVPAKPFLTGISYIDGVILHICHNPARYRAGEDSLFAEGLLREANSRGKRPKCLEVVDCGEILAGEEGNRYSAYATRFALRTERCTHEKIHRVCMNIVAAKQQNIGWC